MTNESPCWYIPGEGRQPTGPFTAEHLIQSWRAGRISEKTMCWRDGMPQWLPLSQVAPFASAIRSAGVSSQVTADAAQSAPSPRGKRALPIPTEPFPQRSKARLIVVGLGVGVALLAIVVAVLAMRPKRGEGDGEAGTRVTDAEPVKSPITPAHDDAKNAVDFFGTDAELAQFVEHLKGTQPLTLAVRGMVTDAGLEHLKTLTQLGKLRLCTNVTGTGLEHLKGLTQLQVLDLEHTRVTDVGLEHLQGLTQLRELLLKGTQVTGAGLKHLQRLTRLQTLDVGRNRVTDAGLEHLKGLTQLQVLDLEDTRVTDAGLVYLKALTKLRKLQLWNNPVTDAGLENLEGLTQLQDLDVGRSKVSDAGLEHLKGLTQLHTLSLAQTQVTDAGLQYLSGLTQLRTLYLSESGVTDAGLKHLKGLARLQTLWLQYTVVTGVGFEHLNGLAQLEKLNLQGSQVTDAGLEHLKGLIKLRELSLWDTKVTDAGLEHLKGLTQLQKLNVLGTNVTDAGVVGLLKALPGLSRVAIHGLDRSRSEFTSRDGLGGNTPRAEKPAPTEPNTSSSEPAQPTTLIEENTAAYDAPPGLGNDLVEEASRKARSGTPRADPPTRGPNVEKPRRPGTVDASIEAPSKPEKNPVAIPTEEPPPSKEPVGKGPLSGTWQASTGAQFRIDDDGKALTISLVYSTDLQKFSGKLTRSDEKPDSKSLTGTLDVLFKRDASKKYDVRVTATIDDQDHLRLRCPEWPVLNNNGKYLGPKFLKETLSRSDGTSEHDRSLPGKE